jgi:hypothetical protein
LTARSVLEVVTDKFPIPLTLREDQREVVETYGPLPRIGMYAEVGCGKTVMSTVIALFKLIVAGNVTIIVMPPVLIRMWKRWLDKIPGVTSVEYVGTPVKRRMLNLNVHFILMSIQVFKNDVAHLEQQLAHRKLTGIVDEATSIKNVQSQNYRYVRNFFEGHDLLLLTGTPLSSPADAYAYVKLIAPTIYRNEKHFNGLHVEERDFFNNVTKWCNLDFLKDNMRVNAVRMLKREALPYLKVPRFVPLFYQLDPKHMALYNKLANEQLLEMGEGGKLDATTPAKLYTCLQQIICNPWYFSGDPTMRSAAHELLDAVLDEVGVGNKLNPKKLLISANYRLTNRGLLQYLQPYGAEALYGEIPKARQQRNIERFIEDPTCGVLIIQPGSGGSGLDGLQHVCSNALFMEFPIISKDFWQVVGRLDRDGQAEEPTIHLPIAERTVQVRLQSNVMDKDALVNRVQGGWKDLREAVFGVS